VKVLSSFTIYMYIYIDWPETIFKNVIHISYTTSFLSENVLHDVYGCEAKCHYEEEHGVIQQNAQENVST